MGWFLLCGCTIAKEDRRVWVGANHLTDWIDVGAIYDYDHQGRCCELVWEDRSPIESITQRTTLSGYCSFLIRQHYATWLLESPNGQPDTYTLRLVNVQK